MKKILVTGGAGFIGANFIRALLKRYEDVAVFNLDKLTYAGDLERLKGVGEGGRLVSIRGDICDARAVEDAFSRGVDTVVHFAAESHVDRSIEDASPFERTNVLGTLTLLDAARRHEVERFVHISTDEVYGELEESGRFFETSPLQPNSPYSASKAAADMFVRAYHQTYGLPTIIVRPSNNYGPWQYPEKLIPVAITRATRDMPVPVYAQGLNVREWLYVEDCAEGVLSVIEKGKPGETYNIGSGQERRNIEVVSAILEIMGKPEGLIEFVDDRPGHDFRYSLSSEKVARETGWSAGVSFEDGIGRTVRWYVEHEAWWRRFL